MFLSCLGSDISLGWSWAPRSSALQIPLRWVASNLILFPLYRQ